MLLCLRNYLHTTDSNADQMDVLGSHLLPRNITNKHPITIFVFIGQYVFSSMKKIHQSTLTQSIAARNCIGTTDFNSLRKFVVKHEKLTPLNSLWVVYTRDITFFKLQESWSRGEIRPMWHITYSNYTRQRFKKEKDKDYEELKVPRIFKTLKVCFMNEILLFASDTKLTDPRPR